MNRETGNENQLPLARGRRLRNAVESVRTRSGRVLRFASRRNTVLSALVLAIPMAALAQPLGLLLWARLRLLTTIPRTAMATEDPSRLAAVEVPLFPDLPESGLDDLIERDPLRISPRHFPRSTPSSSEPEVVPKSDSQSVEEEDREKQLVQERLASIVSEIRVQGLIPGQGVALIDGRACKVGDEVPTKVDGVTFRLLRVRMGSVVIDAGGHEFTLRLIAGGNGSVVIRPEGEELKQP
ncbi:MAG: hypothetical protein P8J59_05080 [Phycisphaerales bacterium]|jgi:hypothetical protein|nr:hypothetical protein [Phycisphaerales bacterium]